MTHPMMPQATHDEAAQQLFVRDLKTYLGGDIAQLHRTRAERLEAGTRANDPLPVVYRALHEDPGFRAWVSVRRTSQEMMWDVVSRSVARQEAALNARAEAADAGGSLTLDPDFEAPEYITRADIHIMPGGYQQDLPTLFQGAVMDRGGAVYMLGRNGGLMNDGRGHTLAAHVFACYPDLAPARILELGCGVGASTVPVAKCFPEAQTYGIDVGSSVLRYAHARAAHLGARIHFVQDNAEHTRFEEGSFDLVFSCALLHETSEPAMAAIMAESFRLLRPGGVTVHLEVPNRYEALGLWERICGEMEADYNNEPNWKEAISADYQALLQQAGFPEVLTGYQATSFAAKPGGGGFSDQSAGTFRSWFVASARKSF
jgi:ubiquinone/menaquinone biosynthesis C-methylase UbiE